MKKHELNRIRHIVQAELENQQEEYNKDKKWYRKKLFDYDCFIAGFVSGMNYSKRLRNGESI